MQQKNKEFCKENICFINFIDFSSCTVLFFRNSMWSGIKSWVTWYVRCDIRYMWWVIKELGRHLIKGKNSY